MGKPKYNLLISVFGLLLLSWIAADRTSAGETEEIFAGGTGTEEDPYLIETAEQLNKMRYNLDQHFKQIADIDLSYYEKDRCWEPMGRYINMDEFEGLRGSFNGNDYIISNIAIDRPETGGAGLFVAIEENARVTNVKLEKADISPLIS